MKIGVIGCGNVGHSTMNAFLKKGFDVVGYDLDESIIKKIREEFGKGRGSNNLEDLINCEVVFECVPTDPKPNSSECDLSIIKGVVSKFSAFESIDDYRCKVFVQRSTCPPGTGDNLARSFNKTKYVVNPSFLTKATKIEDSLTPCRIVIGGDKEGRILLKRIYENFDCDSIFETGDLKSAELLKYIENCTDAVLISVWNEYLGIADALCIEREEFVSIMESFTERDRFSSALRMPSKAFGKWCLPKDLSALSYFADSKGLPSNVLSAAVKTNEIISKSFGVNDLPTTKILSFENNKVKLTPDAVKQFCQANN